MNPDLEHRLQAWVDGELDASSAQEMESLVARDPEARALGENLRLLRGFLQEHEPVRALPETPDFYWSGIRRGIEAEERADRGRESLDPSRETSGRAWWSWVWPAAAAALVLVVISQFPGREGGTAGDLATSSGANSSAKAPAVVPVVGHEIEAPEADGMETVTFYSSQESMTVVWLAHADVL